MRGNPSLATRPGPVGMGGGALDHPWALWARANLFSGWLNTAVTLVVLYFAAKFLFGFLGWGLFNAVWTGSGEMCRAARGVGACWAMISDKHRIILFGLFPFDQQWRPLLAIFLFTGLYAVSSMRWFWNRNLAYVWLGGLTLIGVLMCGGVLGLVAVDTERWGGLALTLILATFGVALAFPLAILLALGRRSRLPMIRVICVGYIELIRGVPLISMLFMASVMLPLFLPEGISINKLLRAQVAIIMFAGAYLAEVVRGGLQAIPKGQFEAADAMGLGYWQKTAMIVLPQALRLVIPPMVNTFIGMFKDTSLVTIIGLFDLLNTAKGAIAEPQWRGFGVEAYLFVSIIYFAYCFAMSKYSQKIETDLSRDRRH